MTDLTYPGPHARQIVPALGLTVERGETVEVPDHMVDALAAQGWTAPQPTTDAQKAPAKKAPARRAGAAKKETS